MMVVDSHTGDTQSQSRIFKALANPYRRLILSTLSDVDGAMTLEELAGMIVSQRDSCPETAEELYLSLYHIHAPKLADAGVVDFDPQQETIRFRGDSQQVNRLLP